MILRRILPLFIVFGLLFTTACTKEQTCEDGIQNQGETGIDCGGPCTACGLVANCFDGIKNQNETGIDCGGVCPACPDESCFDGIQNQDETGVDCGGSCSPCGTTMNPDCPNPAQNGFLYTVDGGPSITPDVISAMLISGNLVINVTDVANNTSFIITQTTANFGTGVYNIGVNTPVAFNNNNTGSIHGTATVNSTGTVSFSEFVQSADCNYVSGSFDLMLSEQQPMPDATVINIIGTFSELEFQ